MAVLSIRLLGSFEIVLDGAPLSGVTSAKAKALLAYLAVEMHRPHSREALAALLWPEGAGQAGRSSLRGVLRELRQVLVSPPDQAPFLCINRDLIQFNPASDHWIDVRAFERAAFDGPAQLTHDVERLLGASALYRGRFLEELVVNAAPFEEWTLLQREALERQALEALSRLAGLLEAGGDFELARDAAHRQLQLDPWCEEAHRQLMRLLALGGNRSAALAQYENCRRALSQELGVEPSVETKQLYQRIRDDLLPHPSRAAFEQRLSPPQSVARDKPSPPANQLRADRAQSLIRLVALLDAAVAGHSNLVVIAAKPAGDGSSYLGVQGLSLGDLICLREVAGEALASLQTPAT